MVNAGNKILEASNVALLADSEKTNSRDSNSLWIEKRGIRFRLRDDLIYYVNGEGRERLCIPESLEAEIFRIAYNLANHSGFYRTYNRLASLVYIRQLVKRLRRYIAYCLDCQVFQTTRYLLYSSLNPLLTPSIPFYIVAIDFIIELPEVGPEKFNILLIIIDKFTKKVALEPGKITWIAVDWVNIVIIALFKRDWGILKVFISDRDPKFILLFWQAIFDKLKVDLLTSTVYYP